MASYGCWDCGSEVAPYQGRCAVCGWPAPPPRRRRRVPKIFLLALLAGFVVFGAVYAMSRAAIPSKAPAWSKNGGHRWVMAYQYRRGDTMSGNVFRCENCGACGSAALGSSRCPGPEETRR